MDEISKAPVSPAPNPCPLCKADVRLFFVNFNEKLLMCENTECEFPFGYEELQFFRENEDTFPEEELDTRSLASLAPRSTPLGSVASEAGWTDIKKINQACTSECDDGNKYEQQALEAKEYINRPDEEPTASVKSNKVEEDLQEIMKMNSKLREFKQPKMLLKKDAFIKELMELQMKCRKKTILKPEEMKLLNLPHPSSEKEVKIELGGEGGIVQQIELKFNITEIIDRKADSVSDEK